MKHRAAFTLLELLTVIVIMGIIIGIGIPVMNSLTRSTGLQGGLRQVSNTANLARQFAVTHRIRTELRVTNTYNAICVFTNNWPVDKWNLLPVGIAIDPASTGTTITFKPTGEAEDKFIIVREGIYDTNPPPHMVATNSNVGTVSVSALLGKVRIQTP
jgi:prepilin-type N-terminal cleavage/methylation domain-containing protein